MIFFDDKPTYFDESVEKNTKSCKKKYFKKK